MEKGSSNNRARCRKSQARRNRLRSRRLERSTGVCKPCLTRSVPTAIHQTYQSTTARVRRNRRKKGHRAERSKSKPLAMRQQPATQPITCPCPGSLPRPHAQSNPFSPVRPLVFPVASGIMQLRRPAIIMHIVQKGRPAYGLGEQAVHNGYAPNTR
jgi:hypothetical protein